MDPITLALLAGSTALSGAGGFLGSQAEKDAAAQMAAATGQASSVYANALKKAKKAGLSGYDDASELVGGAYDDAFDLYGPVRQDATDQLYGDLSVGEDGFGGYQSLLRDSFEASPGYQFRMDQGRRALERSYNSGRGPGLRSGAYDKALTDYSQGRASDEFARHTASMQDYLSRMYGLAGMEQQRAGTAAGMAIGRGGELGNLALNRGLYDAGMREKIGGARAEGIMGQGFYGAQGTTGSANQWINALGNMSQTLGYGAGQYAGQTNPYKKA